MTDKRYPVNKLSRFKNKLKIGKWLLIIIIFINIFLMFYYDQKPELFDVKKVAAKRADMHGHKIVTGFTTTATLLEVSETLLNKPGGYLTNDKLPPSVFMDNMPNWEYGVLVQVRDLARTLRNDFSRSQSQSLEDDDLKIADPRFHYDNNHWILPRTESQYQDAIESLHHYLTRLSDGNQEDAQFYARADNLVSYLNLEKKNAMVSLRQIIRELESTQESIWTPMILNGSGFGLFANHSLVMASYISRANAAIIDLRQLLENG